MTAAPEAPPPAPPFAAAGIKTRILSIDAFRGFVMFLMLAEAMHLMNVRRAFPGNRFWEFVAFNTTHVPWQGCSLHDLIQPAFSFLVGAAMAFSIVSRTSRGESWNRMLLHAMWRSAALIFLGIFLRSLNSRPDILDVRGHALARSASAIRSCFCWPSPRCACRCWRSPRSWSASGLAFVLYPLPPEGFDYTQVGVRADWPHLYSGFLAHFNKNSNLSWAFDVWFLNLFPRAKPFLYNGGGWSTLSFIPTLATMMLGLWAGRWLMTSRSTTEKLKGLVIGGVALTLAGLILQWLHINPIIKRIWTSSYTLYSGGLVVLILAGFYALIELKGWKRWAFPLLVIGANSIAVYVMSWTMESFVSSALVRHLGTAPFLVFGPPFEPVLRGFGVVLVFWLILFWMYRRRIFLRI